MADISTEVAAIQSASRGEEVRDSIVSALNAINTGTEATANKVTSITGTSTDTQYPSAAAVWALFNSITNANGVSY